MPHGANPGIRFDRASPSRWLSPSQHEPAPLSRQTNRHVPHVGRRRCPKNEAGDTQLGSGASFPRSKSGSIDARLLRMGHRVNLGLGGSPSSLHDCVDAATQISIAAGTTVENGWAVLRRNAGGGSRRSVAPRCRARCGPGPMDTVLHRIWHRRFVRRGQRQGSQSAFRASSEAADLRPPWGPVRRRSHRRVVTPHPGQQSIFLGGHAKSKHPSPIGEGQAGSRMPS